MPATRGRRYFRDRLPGDGLAAAPQRRHLRAPRRDRPLDQLYKAEPEPGRRFHVQDSRRRKAALSPVPPQQWPLCIAREFTKARKSPRASITSWSSFPPNPSPCRENYFYYAHYYAAQAMWQSGGKTLCPLVPRRPRRACRQTTGGRLLDRTRRRQRVRHGNGLILCKSPTIICPYFSDKNDSPAMNHLAPVNTPRALAAILISFNQSENMEISGTPNTKRAIARNLQLAICSLQFAFILLFLILSLFSPQFLYAVPVAVPVEGRPFVAQPASIDATGRIVSQAAEKRQLPLRDLVAWAHAREAKAPGPGPGRRRSIAGRRAFLR